MSEVLDVERAQRPVTDGVSRYVCPNCGQDFETPNLDMISCPRCSYTWEP